MPIKQISSHKLIKKLTSAPFFNFLCSFDCPGCSLLLFLLGTASVEVFNDNPDKHVKYKEANKEKERDKINQSPLIKVLFWLKKNFGEQIV